MFDLLVQTRSDLPLQIANALVTRFFASGGHPLTVILMLRILDDLDKAEELLDLDAEAPLSALLARIYASLTDAERLAVDVLSLAGQALPIDEVQAFVRKLMGAEGMVVEPPRVALRAGDKLELHPLVRSTLTDLVRTRNTEHFRRVHQLLADACQRAAADVSRVEALPLLWRAVQHLLQANDVRQALAIYDGTISNEPPPGDPLFGRVWRSVKQDFAYELENKGLASLLEHPFWKGPALPSAVAAMHANLLMRRLWVDRALGRMDSADGLGQKLWRKGIGGEDQSETLGQICLTTLICGRILRDEAPQTAANPRYAGYWSTCALAEARKLPENRRGFPVVRSLVYRGAYLHRTDCPADAHHAFQEALTLQAKLHRSDAEQPPVLVGVNAYLYIWFLIDMGNLTDASALVEEVLKYLDELKGNRRTKLVNSERQWRVMANLSAVWVAQEHALLDAHKGQAATAKRHYDDVLRLLLEIDNDVQYRRDAIAYDLRSTFVRARLRQHAMEGRPELAERELKRSVDNYARAGARAFAADCQTDLLRLYSSSASFSGSSWVRPSNSTQRAAAVRLDDLARHYPLAQKQWFRTVPLRTFR